MKIIESMLRGKYRDQLLCEDGIFIGNKIVAVIDGVTSHGTLFWHGGSSGRFAKDMLCEYLRSHEDELAEVSAKECFHRLNCVLAERGRKVYPSLYEGTPAADRLAEYPRACVILFNSVAGEVWSYGDCRCRIGEKLHCEEKEVDRLLSELRTFVIMSGMREQAAHLKAPMPGFVVQHAFSDEPEQENVEQVLGIAAFEKEYLEKITKHDIGRGAVVPMIEKQLWFENKPGMFGYPVLNGLNFAEEMIKVWTVPSGTEVVLASDGYPQLRRTLEESEAKLREIIAEDPLCLGVGGGKAGVKGIMEGMESFDDRSYVRVIA